MNLNDIQNLKIKKGVIIFVISLFVLGIVYFFIFPGRMYSLFVTKKEVSILNDFVTESINGKLKEGVIGTRDCYPQDSYKNQCTSLTFSITKETCSDVEKTLLKTNSDSKKEFCLSEYGEAFYKNRKIGMYFGEGNNNGEYWVQFWIE